MSTSSPHPAMARGVVVLLALLLVVACSPTSSLPSPGPVVIECLESLPGQAPVSGLFVEPDDGLDPVLRELEVAVCTIDISVYILSEDLVIDALGRAADRGVRVRVMLEEYPFGGGGDQLEVMERLERDGVAVRWSASDIRFSHAKYAVIDRQVALIMNQNLTGAAFRANREFGITTTEPDAVDQAQTIFDRDWEHQPLDDPAGPLVVSPSNSRERLLGLIGGAERTIDFYAEVIRDQEIVNALGAAEDRGVEVRLVVDASIDEATEEIAAQLHDRGVEIRLAEHLYIHAKLMVIDGDIAIVGSQNFTSTSLDDNRELAIVANDPLILGRCVAIFERDWQRAIPGAPTSGMS